MTTGWATSPKTESLGMKDSIGWCRSSFQERHLHSVKPASFRHTYTRTHKHTHKHADLILVVVVQMMCHILMTSQLVNNCSLFMNQLHLFLLLSPQLSQDVHRRIAVHGLVDCRLVLITWPLTNVGRLHTNTHTARRRLRPVCNGNKWTQSTHCSFKLLTLSATNENRM